MKHFDIITIFPQILDSYFSESLFKRAQAGGLLEIKTHNLRDFTLDKHKKVDDKPYGGGPGMVLMAEPISRVVESLKSKVITASGGTPPSKKLKISGGESPKSKVRVILFSLRGKKFDQKEAHRLSKYNQLIFICGRYEGVDERVAQYVADEELSVGDFVLSGGELPAAIVIEAVARLIPGFLGKSGSLEELKGTYPTYTKPETVLIKKQKRSVPKVLLSGHHKEIDKWRSEY